jgi:hypothetical protein
MLSSNITMQGANRITMVTSKPDSGQMNTSGISIDS